MTRADYEACQKADETGFRGSIEALTLKSLEAGVKTFDYRGSVERQWRRAGMDDLLAKRIDVAIEEVRSETSWAGLAQSLINSEKAQEISAAVAERVYTSDVMKTAIEGLATGVGNEVGQTLELASQDAVGPSLECLRAFLGGRYGTTVARIVSGDVEHDFGVQTQAGRAAVSSGTVLQQSSQGIAGAAMILMRRQLANIAARVGQRLAGSILARLVSVAAGGVGLVLVAKDIWELRNGVLPIIAEEMKSDATKGLVKDELAKTIAEQINAHLNEIAAKAAERVIEIWRSFQNAHQKALDLAQRDEAFRRFLDTVKPEQLARLDEVVALILAKDGEAGVLKRLGDGALNEAVRFLPEPAMMIARDTRSIDAALGWSSLAGDQLPKVLEHEVYRRAGPDGFTRATLSALLKLDDHVAITRLAALPADARDRLFGLGTEDLKRLARAFSESELESLSRYLDGLEPGPRARVLAAIAATPGKMQSLATPRVRSAVLASRDQARAVDMMLREGSGSPETILNDVAAAWDGNISPILIWEKHPLVVIGAGVAVLFFLLLLRRLFRPRRPAGPAQTTA
ncbi:hypothetical protein [Hyphomicrobium sp. CS1GBMeth3]|uniref:hypothetical protein n=1 Tax=Hyphomicrobium sp. CS1GBMeth3 TaxID=1892845 RepID=UPI000931DE9A|nr:hypothetical protein [Hyphomicrobium sp. CS1GBMeth3]